MDPLLETDADTTFRRAAMSMATVFKIFSLVHRSQTRWVEQELVWQLYYLVVGHQVS
jgi:hypothetical protein